MSLTPNDIKVLLAGINSMDSNFITIVDYTKDLIEKIPAIKNDSFFIKQSKELGDVVLDTIVENNQFDLSLNNDISYESVSYAIDDVFDKYNSTDIVALSDIISDYLDCNYDIDIKSIVLLFKKNLPPEVFNKCVRASQSVFGVGSKEDFIYNFSTLLLVAGVGIFGYNKKYFESVVDDVFDDYNTYEENPGYDAGR